MAIKVVNWRAKRNNCTQLTSLEY